VPVPRRFDRQPPERDTTRVNERIRVPEVRLIDDTGQQVGIMRTQDALRRAQEKDLDLVLCLGDYMYEHHYYDGPTGRVDKTGANHDGDVQTLAEYRQKYRFYQSDKNLQNMHASHPFVVIWDDHEVEDNYAGTHPDSASTDPAHFENNNSYARRLPFSQHIEAIEGPIEGPWSMTVAGTVAPLERRSVDGDATACRAP